MSSDKAETDTPSHSIQKSFDTVGEQAYLSLANEAHEFVQEH